MARDLNLATKLRAAGLRVVEVNGWRTRGADTFNPRGLVWHHTAGARTGNAPSLGLCIRGRSDLPGPLCNVLIGRDATCYVVAAGRANHAGAGGWEGLRGNSSVYGVEIENVGTAAEPWSVPVLDAAARVAAALAPPRLCAMHKEWAPGRKVDMHTVSGADLRGRTAQVLARPAGADLQRLAAAIAAARTQVLRRGDRGDHVKALQVVLMSKGAAQLRPDGVFGAATETVVKFVQTLAGIKADGVVGPATWAVLLK
jgi:hypothetical protein